MSTEALEFIVRVHHEDDGSLWAEVLDLPGCFASGGTLDELWEGLEESISLYLADNPEAGKIRHTEKDDKPPRKPMQVDEMRVKIPA